AEDVAEDRATRTQRDALDLALTELTGFYRDVLARQLGLGPPLPRTAESRKAPASMVARRIATPRTM
ncbi:hypothetical protein ACFWHH_19020, partial [Streptomyces massasporeus]